MMKVELTGALGQHKTIDAAWVHGTYNATLWLSTDDDGAETADLYHSQDRQAIGLEFEPVHVSIEGELKLYFYHGRQTVNEDMDDWGSDAPIILVKRFSLDRLGMSIVVEDGDLSPVRLTYEGGLLYWQGVYYGDFDISPRGSRQ